MNTSSEVKMFIYFELEDIYLGVSIDVISVEDGILMYKIDI